MKQLILDVGGTYIKYAYFVDEKVTVGSFPVTDSNGKEDFTNALRNFLKNYQVDEIGISMPGPFDFTNGISYMDFKLPSIYKKNIKTIFTDIFPNTKILFMHDAVAFALGALEEKTELKDINAMVIMLGTGLGYGYLDHGHVLVDKSKTTTPDLGRSPYLEVGKHVEDFVSATALVRLANEAGYNFKYVKDMANAAKTDKKLQDIFHQVGMTLGKVMNEQGKKFPYSFLMIGGGVSNVWHLLKSGFEETNKVSYQIISDSTMCPINGVRHALKLNNEDLYLKYQTE
ncbi:MAG: ROK family protein [Bacilli bacterium]|nr:ROK family protein [Bacilli bacterium]